MKRFSKKVPAFGFHGPNGWVELPSPWFRMPFVVDGTPYLFTFRPPRPGEETWEEWEKQMDAAAQEFITNLLRRLRGNHS